MGRQAPKLTEADFAQAAAALDVDVASVKAVTDVESRGDGFLADGRPVILFERHVFYRRLKLHGQSADHIARRRPDICSAQPGGYIGGAREHDRLAAAKSFHEVSALESASVGLFQIMGFHWKLLGYPSASAFWSAMEAGEGNHLDAFVRFVKANPGMLRAMRSRDWSAFARAYNGPAFAKNKYDAKLAAAYAKHAGVPA